MSADMGQPPVTVTIAPEGVTVSTDMATWELMLRMVKLAAQAASFPAFQRVMATVVAADNAERDRARSMTLADWTHRPAPGTPHANCWCNDD